LDLVTTNSLTNTVTILRNTSIAGAITSGSFASRVDFTSGNYPEGVVVGDIDGDGEPDIVFTNKTSGTVSVYRNTISLNAPVPPVITSFTPTSGPVGTTVTITGTNFSPTPANNIVKFGTLQAVVTASTSTQLTVILPAGTTNNPISVTVNGLTGSSATPFVVTAPSPPPVITSLSQTFGYVGMTLIINGTNFSTTLANNIVWFGAVKANVTVATTTQLQVTVPAGATYQPVTVTVNGLTAYSKSPFIVTFPSLQIFDGSTLAPKVEIPCSTGWSYFAVICDIDVNGKPDLLVVNAGGGGKIMIFRNTGNPGSISSGSFTAGIELTISGGAYGIAVGDIDGDGKPDIAATSQSNNLVTVLRNQSTPGSITTESFGAGIDFQTGSRPGGIAIGDIDGDGKPDLAVSNYGDGVSQSSYTVSIFKNTGMPGSISAGSFAPKVDFQSSHGGVYVAFNDLDMDGKPDLIITTFTMNISIFRNTSTPGEITTGSFSPKVDLSGSNGLNSSAVGDIDGDGKPDLVFVNKENSSVSVLRNISTPGSITRNSFSSGVEFPAGTNPYEVDLGDIDGDGKPDMVVANNENTIISLLKNTSSPGSINSGSFNPKIDFNIGSGQGTLSIGDIDGDTKPDIFVKHWYSNTISILRNNMPTPNLPVINTINPNSGPVGSTITINGSNFSPVAGNNTVMFGTVQGTVTSASNNQLTVIVPVGADGQPVIVMVYGYWINSGITFSVVTPDDIELESSILTLNGDGINDGLVFKYFEIYGHSSFYVYNSRGALIYSKKDYQNDWDLTINGHLLDTGGYFYVIETDLGVFRGSFSILR
jgi:gliding motility-associated-like protein